MDIRLNFIPRRKSALFPSPQRLNFAFRHDQDGYWLRDLHICGDFTVEIRPLNPYWDVWTKTLRFCAHDGRQQVVIDDEELEWLEGLPGELRKRGLWVNDRVDPELALKLLVLFCWAHVDNRFGHLLQEIGDQRNV
jgi:hypothetical protein